MAAGDGVEGPGGGGDREEPRARCPPRTIGMRQEQPASHAPLHLENRAVGIGIRTVRKAIGGRDAYRPRGPKTVAERKAAARKKKK